MWFFETGVTYLLDRKYQNRYWVGIIETWYTFSYKHPKVMCVCVCVCVWLLYYKCSDLREINLRSISFISQYFVSMSLHPISKGSYTSIVLQISKVICVVFLTYCKISFLRSSDYPISLLSSFMLILLVIILRD